MRSLDMLPDSLIKLLLEQEREDIMPEPPEPRPPEDVDDGTSYGGTRNTGGWAV